MIMEHALLQVKPGQADQFRAAMEQARPLIAAQPGFQSISVRGSFEDPDQFLLLVGWDRIESHAEGFRKSPEYLQWRDLLHDFYNPMPSVNYFGPSLFDD